MATTRTHPLPKDRTVEVRSSPDQVNKDLTGYVTLGTVVCAPVNHQENWGFTATLLRCPSGERHMVSA